MFASEVNLLWTVFIATFLFFTLAGTIVAVVVLNQRRHLRHQKRMLDELRQEIEARRKAQDEVTASEQRYRNLVENINGMYCILDVELNVVYASPNLGESLGMKEEELVGSPFAALIDRRDRKRVTSFLAECAERGVVDTSSTFRLSHRGGGTLWVEQNTRINRDEAGAVAEFRSVMWDVTERRRAESAMKTLSNRIVLAQEAERRRVARELHDGIVQLLSSIQFRLQSAGNGASTRKRAPKGAHEAAGLLDEAIQEVRRISHNLRPSALDDLGIAPALRIMCEEFAAKTSMKVDFRYPENSRHLSENVEVTLFRTIQEALNNIAKHSGATRVDLHVGDREGCVEALISDNGRGFSRKSSGKNGGSAAGMGLEAMKERVRFLGGSVDISSEPKKGVRILVRLPHNERRVREK